LDRSFFRFVTIHAFDGQTDGRTAFSSLDRVCIPCSSVKKLRPNKLRRISDHLILESSVHIRVTNKRSEFAKFCATRKSPIHPINELLMTLFRDFSTSIF